MARRDLADVWPKNEESQIQIQHFRILLKTRWSILWGHIKGARLEINESIPEVSIQDKEIVPLCKHRVCTTQPLVLSLQAKMAF